MEIVTNFGKSKSQCSSFSFEMMLNMNNIDYYYGSTSKDLFNKLNSLMLKL